MNIPELPDYKAYRSEIDKYIDERKHSVKYIL